MKDFQKRFIYVLVLLWLNTSCNTSEVYYHAIKRCSPNREGNIGGIIIMKELNCLVGAALPKFQGVDMKGKKISKLDLAKSKYNLLNFWFIGCPPCVEEMDELNELNQYPDLSVFSFCRDSKKEIQNSGLDFSFPVVPAAKVLINEVFKIPYGYPTNILTDNRGRILLVFLSVDRKYESFSELDSILQAHDR